MRRAIRLAAFGAATLLAACAAVGPDHRSPAVNTGPGWASPVGDAEADPAVLARWWAALGDPQLVRLIDQSLAHNLELRQAQANIDSARALLARAESLSSPALSASGNVQRQRSSVNSPEYNPQRSPDQTVYDTGLSASWEIDLFGSLRRQREAATASLEASKADTIGLRLAVAAEVARTYASLRGAQRELAAREAAVSALERLLALTERRWRAGDVARADLERAQARLDQGRALLPAVMNRRQAAVLALGPLLGGLPEAELALLDTAGVEPMFPPLAVGQRADLLRRRPDVAAAERRLAAATAEIGVATAELFPKLSLTAAAGFRALSASDFLDLDSRRGAIGPVLSWRLFDGGRVRAEIRASEAREQGAALGYEKAVLGAIAEAEKAISQYRLGLQALAAQQQALESLRRQVQTTRTRYELGDAPILDWLDGQRELADSEAALAQLRASSATDLVLLFKALGGGWDAPTQVGTRPPP